MWRVKKGVNLNPTNTERPDNFKPASACASPDPYFHPFMSIFAYLLASHFLNSFRKVSLLR